MILDIALGIVLAIVVWALRSVVTGALILLILAVIAVVAHQPHRLCWRRRSVRSSNISLVGVSSPITSEISWMLTSRGLRT